MKVYRVAHIDIDGAIIDRDDGYPDLELEMHPMGTELLREQQTRQLHLKIGRGPKTVLEEEGIAALKAFLDERP